MRIAIIIEDVNKIAGQERVVAELAQRLAPHHDLHLFCYTATDLPDKVTIHRLRQPPCRFFMARALWMVVASLFAVKPGRFDVILSQGGNALQQTHTLVHNCLARRWELTRNVYWRLRPPSLPQRAIRTAWYRIVVALERRAVRRCRNGRTLAVSAELADLLAHYHGVPRNEIQVCENGVDHERFRPDPGDPARSALRQQLGLGDEVVLALFLGGIWLEKGATYSLQALAQTDSHVHLCLAGREDPAPFQALAEKLGVTERVHFLPPTHLPWEYYHAADLFLFPAHAEGFGLVAVEAAACGLPVLMTRVGVAERLITDGMNGYLISHDPAEIAARLNLLAAEPQLRHRMGEAAANASERFSWDRQAAEIEAALTGALR